MKNGHCLTFVKTGLDGKRNGQSTHNGSVSRRIYPKSPRHRGVLAAHYPNGKNDALPKLCGHVALAITIDAEERKDGSRKTTRFDIDVFKCINCGFCEEACPVDSIVATSENHYALFERGQNIMTKETLLAIGDAFEKDIVHNQRQDKE